MILIVDMFYTTCITNLQFVFILHKMNAIDFNMFSFCLLLLHGDKSHMSILKLNKNIFESCHMK